MELNLLEQCLTPWALVINQVAANPCRDVYSSGIPTESTPLMIYLGFFLKTLLLEFPIYFLFLRRNFGFLKILKINLLINLATHPFIFLILPSILDKWDMNYLQYLVIAEIFAPTVEALLLNRAFKVNLGRAILAALTANLISWSIGVFIR